MRTNWAMQILERTRRKPGPRFLMMVCCLFLAGAVLRAHDPGLSALDISVKGDTISASLSIAASDVALLAPGGGADARAKLLQLAHEAIRVSIDGEELPSRVEDVSIDAGGVQARWSLAIPASPRQTRRLSIASDVPGQLSRGHRELVVVRVDDRVVTERLLDAESDPVAIDLASASPSDLRAAWQYLELGVRHILSGYDHLVFLAGLLLAAVTLRELVVALTAFTAAHSVSLALVTIGGLHAPPSIVEPLIAASIAWVGLENLRRRGQGTRWFVVFAFGLIHGFGFAGALVELGIGSSVTSIALALLSFNAGVEAGQLVVAAALWPLVWMMRTRPLWQARLLPVCSIMMLLAGSYWTIERLL